MSSGTFSRSKYELDGGIVCPIRVQPETLALDIDGATNDAPAGNVTLSVSVYARKGKREYGIGARNIVIAFTAGAPAGYKDEPLSVPILTPAVFTGINVGDTGTYLGSACEVISKAQEVLT